MCVHSDMEVRPGTVQEASDRGRLRGRVDASSKREKTMDHLGHCPAWRGKKEPPQGGAKVETLLRCWEWRM